MAKKVSHIIWMAPLTAALAFGTTLVDSNKIESEMISLNFVVLSYERMEWPRMRTYLITTTTSVIKIIYGTFQTTDLFVLTILFCFDLFWQHSTFVFVFVFVFFVLHEDSKILWCVCLVVCLRLCIKCIIVQLVLSDFKRLLSHETCWCWWWWSEICKEKTFNYIIFFNNMARLISPASQRNYI